MGWSTKAKRGRKPKAAVKWDYGNSKAQARAALFRHFRGDSGIGHESSCAGRLMLVGAFDGLEVAPEVILNNLLYYQNAYWAAYGGGPQMLSMETRGRSTSLEGLIEKRFGELDQLLRDCGHEVRKAVIDCTVDRHWFPDEDVSWAARIINSRIMDKRRQYAGREVPEELAICGELATPEDWAMLELLRHGASALAGGGMRRAA